MGEIDVFVVLICSLEIPIGGVPCFGLGYTFRWVKMLGGIALLSCSNETSLRYVNWLPESHLSVSYSCRVLLGWRALRVSQLRAKGASFVTVRFIPEVWVKILCWGSWWWVWMAVIQGVSGLRVGACFISLFGWYGCSMSTKDVWLLTSDTQACNQFWPIVCIWQIACTPGLCVWWYPYATPASWQPLSVCHLVAAVCSLTVIYHPVVVVCHPGCFVACLLLLNFWSD